MQITDICKFDFGHVVIEKRILICLHCHERSVGLTNKEQFFDHLYLISGFVEAHKDCKK